MPGDGEGRDRQHFQHEMMHPQCLKTKVFRILQFLLQLFVSVLKDKFIFQDLTKILKKPIWALETIVVTIYYSCISGCQITKYISLD